MKLLSVFALSLVYAAQRYLVFGTVAIANLPCFVVNKAAALGSILALTLAAYNARKGRVSEHQNWFSTFKALLFLHIMLSLFLFSADYYPKMFTSGKMNLFGELFMFFGVVAVCLLLYRTIVRDASVKVELLQALSLAAIALHNLFLGVGNWGKWQDWPGHMPPITMISFILPLIALAFQFTSRKA